ncbi:MAG: hypothetical protein WD512_18845 [Candidatus Paceibacterota bacterium]
MSNYIIPILPPGSITSNNTHNTPGMGNSIIATGATNPILQYTYTIPIHQTNSVIIGGGDKVHGVSNTSIISATLRPFQADSDANGTLFLRADKGIMIETTTPGEFINASEELEKIDDILDELREIKDMLHDIYWAPPNGPGYLKSKMNFDNLMDEVQVPKSTEFSSNTPPSNTSPSNTSPSNTLPSISSTSPSTIISSSASTSTSTIISSPYSTYDTNPQAIDNTSYSVRGCNIQ